MLVLCSGAYFAWLRWGQRLFQEDHAPQSAARPARPAVTQHAQPASVSPPTSPTPSTSVENQLPAQQTVPSAVPATEPEKQAALPQAGPVSAWVRNQGRGRLTWWSRPANCAGWMRGVTASGSMGRCCTPARKWDSPTAALCGCDSAMRAPLRCNSKGSRSPNSDPGPSPHDRGAQWRVSPDCGR